MSTVSESPIGGPFSDHSDEPYDVTTSMHLLLDVMNSHERLLDPNQDHSGILDWNHLLGNNLSATY